MMRDLPIMSRTSGLHTRIMTAQLYLNTMRYLKPSQLFWRLAYKIRKPQRRRIGPIEVRLTQGTWQRAPAKPAAWLGELRFRFLNMEHAMSRAGDWNNSTLPKLWLYNLHYFDWLQSASAANGLEQQHALMRSWIAENAFGFGNGWEPYPVSLRIVNWAKFALTTGALPSDIERSLAVQTDFLSQRIEYDLLGNHLMANAKGLLFGGWFFRGSDADRWAALGLDLLERELKEQVLPDGGHFERSAMYHSTILEDVLDLINLAHVMDVPVPRTWTDAAARMRSWLLAMTHDDGGIALFNDAAFGIAPDPAEIEAYSARLGLPEMAPLQPGLLPLANSGYFRWQAGRAVVIGDIGDVGPHYQPGHGHADTLSFELSLGPDRMIVDTGTSTYAVGEERLRQRSTAAHNTVSIDGQNSSEVWSSFRIARRATISGLEIPDDRTFVRAAHDGYRRLAGGPLHQRCWRLEPNTLSIVDEITGEQTHAVAMTFCFHPMARIVLDGAKVTGSLAGSTFQVNLPSALTWTIEPSQWHPRFGDSQPNQKLVGRVTLRLPHQFTTQFNF